MNMILPQPNRALAESVLEQIKDDLVDFINQGLKPSCCIVDSETYLGLTEILSTIGNDKNYNLYYCSLQIKIAYNKSGLPLLDYVFDGNNFLRLYKENKTNSIDFILVD